MAEQRVIDLIEEIDEAICESMGRWAKQKKQQGLPPAMVDTAILAGLQQSATGAAVNILARTGWDSDRLHRFAERHMSEMLRHFNEELEQR
jgi:hypothetical protein